MNAGFLAVGLGCRKGCAATDIASAVDAVLREAQARDDAPRLVAGLFTTVEKQGEPGLAEAAARLGLALVYLPRQALETRSDGAETRSQRVVDLFGVPSVAETAALAGAGPGSVLVVPRRVSGGATAAVAAKPSSPSQRSTSP